MLEKALCIFLDFTTTQSLGLGGALVTAINTVLHTTFTGKIDLTPSFFASPWRGEESCSILWQGHPLFVAIDQDPSLLTLLRVTKECDSHIARRRLWLVQNSAN
jgi:hypothetical protein